MSKTTKFFIFLGIFLLSANFAHAASFSANVTPIKDKIVVNEAAEFNVVIQNNLDTEEEFAVKKAGYPFWDMYTKPLQNPITVKVSAHGSSLVHLFVDALYITSVDTYTLDTGVVLQRTGEEIKVPITIGIKSTEPLIGGYIPTVLSTTSIVPENIDPREEVRIIVALNNQNVINYSNLTVKIESSLLKDELHVPLGPKEEKPVEIIKKLGPMNVPQNDRLIVAVFLDKRMIVSPSIKEFRVREYITEEDIPKEESFLKIRKGKKVVSNNPDYHGTIKIETTSFKNLFTTTAPHAQAEKEDGKYFLVWKVELDQNRSMSVYTVENYRPVVVIIALAIIAVFLYFLFRSPIVVKKGIVNVGISEGGISGAKVVVRVKNRSPKQISNIEVIDHIPHIAHVEKDLSIGSMQPHAILQHPKKGVIIKWNIEALEAGDERVLSYAMKSRLPILGEFNLPSATARCSVNNRMIISNSNRVAVGSN